MQGDLIIDNIDVYDEFGAYVLRGGYNGLVQWPASKAVDTVAWQESDYAEADLSSLRLEAKEFTMGIGLRCALEDTDAFYVWLSESVYRTWEFARIGVTKTLRVVGISGIQTAGTVHILTVRLADDTPLSGYSYLAPTTSLSAQGDYTLDGVDVSTYGVRVLEGTLDSTARPSDIKELLKRRVSTVNGVLYDGRASRNTVKTREATLKCAIIEATVRYMWRNHNAFLYDLIRAKETLVETDACRRALYSSALDKTFLCYYKSESVTDVAVGYRKNLILFNITLEIIGQE